MNPDFSQMIFDIAAHTGLSEVFTDWLWVNGWHCECFDYGSYMIIPAVALDRLGEAA